MNTARFHAPGFAPGATLAALSRIEAAVFDPNLPPSTMQAEVREGLRQARDALTDTDATIRAFVATLNNAHGLVPHDD